jgi:hypothetical protein
MKRIAFSLFVGLVLVLFGANLSAQATEPPTKSELQQMYVSYLKAADATDVTIDKDGDVNFIAGAGRFEFYIDIDAQLKDPNYFRVVLQPFGEYKTSSARAKAYEAVNNANRTTRVAKVYITSGNKVAIIAEAYIAKPEDAKVHFKRMLTSILTARETFADSGK